MDDTVGDETSMERDTTDGRELTELSVDECERLLGKSPIGRVGFSFSGKQVVLPVNFRYLDGQVLFRTLFGQKLHVAAARNQVAFEVDEWDEQTRTGWSVLVKGKAEQIIDYDSLVVADELGATPWAEEASEGRWVRVVPEEITGRRLG